VSASRSSATPADCPPCLDAGLLDEVHVDLIPVFLGSGIPLLGMIKDAPVELDGPISVTEGKAVTHLAYRVVRK
jgi:dihydrofolate reductase